MAKENLASRRKRRIRYQLKNSGKLARPRLSVFRSNGNISAQIIDDKKGITIASSSTMEKEVRNKIKSSTGNVEAAKIVGQLIAERAKSAKIKEVVFDRGSYLYHGRVKALADAAREAGLSF